MTLSVQQNKQTSNNNKMKSQQHSMADKTKSKTESKIYDEKPWRILVWTFCKHWMLKDIYYIVKSICSPLQIIDFSCFCHFDALKPLNVLSV